MAAMKMTTVIVNDTNDVLKVKVGDHQHIAEVASIAKGGQWNLHVNVNETYREFRLQDSSGTNVMVVSSDDCCDHECITIKETAAADVDTHVVGKFEVHRVPRRRRQNSDTFETSSAWEVENNSSKRTGSAGFDKCGRRRIEL